MKKLNQPKHTKPYEWSKGTYNAGEIINNEWVYYDYFGNSNIADENRFEENEQKFSWKMKEEKFNYYRTLVYFPKHISIIKNQTSTTDTQLKKYVCEIILKEENEITRERNNAKRRKKNNEK